MAEERASGKKPPWRRKPSAASRRRGAQKLTPAEKESARKRAADAGRRYPNLVDNMWIVSQRRKKTPES